jgi:DNA-binding GntR family transcriptional regulator
MSNNKIRKTRETELVEAFTPLSDSLQMGVRIYKILVNSVVTGKVSPGTHLRPDAIASQLDVSTTPVREAMQRLEADGLVVKVPYQGWFVREFTEKEVRQLYEYRASLERFSVRLACQYITPKDVMWLRKHQAYGKAAIKSKDMEAYRAYNRDFHQRILGIANNSYLVSAMAQVALQSETLTAKAVNILGRPLRAIEEHAKLIDLMENHKLDEVQKLMERHIMSALEAIISSNAAIFQSQPQRGNGLLSFEKVRVRS